MADFFGILGFLGFVFFAAYPKVYPFLGSMFSNNACAKGFYDFSKGAGGNFLSILCILIFFTAYLFAQDGLNESAMGGIFLFILIIFLVVGVYFVPSYVCFFRKVENKSGIILLNIFLGWTGLGWVGALIWASIAPTLKSK